MNLYGNLVESVEFEYDKMQELKKTEQKSLLKLRHKKSGTRYLFRQYQGSAEVYRKLLPVTCRHLPQIYEVAEQDGTVAVLEEFVQGDTLQFLLEADVLSAKKVRDIAIQLCQALWVLHSMGIVHRDIKPENVILRGDEVVLLDFDAARIYKREHSTDTVVLGTIGYAAPEQFGWTQSDERADIYSMGILLNVMLTGKHPAKELAPGRWGHIVQHCPMMNPKKRYKNVKQLMEAL